MKYSQIQNKFFIKVPVANNKLENNLSYMDCYVYGYVCKFSNELKNIHKNLQINKNKLKITINKLKNIELITEKNKKFYSNREKEKEFFLFDKNQILFDVTFLPNLEYLNFYQNAVYWKLFKYADPVDGMKNCLTLGCKLHIEKISYNYLKEILKISKNSLSESLKQLTILELIKIKKSGSGFYFGVQPIKEEMNRFWRDTDSLYRSEIFYQEEIYKFCTNNIKFYLK